MNRAELLALAAAAHTDWADEFGDTVPAVPADSAPHDGKRSDYAEHHADRSAPAEVDDELSGYLAELMQRRDDDDLRAAADRAQAAGPAPTEK